MKLSVSLFLLLFTLSCRSQPETSAEVKSRLVGGPCEICDAIEGYDDQALRAVDTLPDFELSNRLDETADEIFYLPVFRNE